MKNTVSYPANILKDLVLYPRWNKHTLAWRCMRVISAMLRGTKWRVYGVTVLKGLSEVMVVIENEQDVENDTRGLRTLQNIWNYTIFNFC